MALKRRRFLALAGGAVAAGAAASVGGCAFLRSGRFGGIPAGVRMERILRSPNWKGGRFANLDPTPLMASSRGRWRAFWDYFTAKKAKVVPGGPIPSVRRDLKHLPPDGDVFVWFGHSSYLMRIGGRTILVDPVFHTAAPLPIFNRPFPGTQPYSTDDIPPVDLLVITHDHWDHLDLQTLEELHDRIGRIVCPLGVGAHLERWGFAADCFDELDWHEAASVAGGRITCLPARHFSGRGLESNQTLWASFLLESGGRRIYIGGDGGYGSHFKAIGEAHPGIDLAILEDGQYNESWRYIHTMPDLLSQVVRDLNPAKVIPVHHMKYALSTHSWHEPVEVAERAAKETGVPFLFPMIGEVTRI